MRKNRGLRRLTAVHADTVAISQSRLVTLPFGEQGARGSITLTLAAALFLGFTRNDITPGTVTVQLGAKNYRRSAWMGGPTVPVNREAQTSVRQLGSVSSKAKTNKRLILEASGTQETVYFTGTQARAVAFLLDKAQGASFVIRSAHGRDLMPVLPADD